MQEPEPRGSAFRDGGRHGRRHQASAIGREPGRGQRELTTREGADRPAGSYARGTGRRGSAQSGPLRSRPLAS